MPDRVTYAQAAEILGCHVSNVPKLIQRGLLTSVRRRKGALDRHQVEQLAAARAHQRDHPKPRRRTSVDRRPDAKHDWLTPTQVAKLLGVTPTAVRQRIHRDRLPATAVNGRIWVRRDLLEQVEAARLVRRTRRP